MDENDLNQNHNSCAENRFKIKIVNHRK